MKEAQLTAEQLALILGVLARHAEVSGALLFASAGITTSTLSAQRASLNALYLRKSLSFG